MDDYTLARGMLRTDILFKRQFLGGGRAKREGNPQMDEALKEQVAEFVKKKTERGKGLNSMRDIVRGCNEHDKRDVRKAVQALIEDDILAYWSSGSTTYIRLAGYEPGDEGLTD